MKSKKLKSIGEDVYKTINKIDTRLTELSLLIKENQPKKPGSITLHFYSCGKDCLGCPFHATWLKWYSAPRNKEKKFTASSVQNPLRKLKRKGSFDDGTISFDDSYKITRGLVIEAIYLIKKRKEIIKDVSNLNRRVFSLNKKN